jgi:hypothetical protein
MKNSEEIKLDFEKLKSFLTENLFSVASLRYLFIVIGGTSVFSAFLIAGYCHRYGLPFFEALDQLGKYLLYINLFSLFFVSLVFLFFLAPAITLELYEKDLQKKIFYSIPRMKSKKYKNWSNLTKEIMIFSIPRNIFAVSWLFLAHCLFLLVMIIDNSSDFYWIFLLIYTMFAILLFGLLKENSKFMKERFLKLERIRVLNNESAIKSKNFINSIDTLNCALMSFTYIAWLIYAMGSPYEETKNSFIVSGPIYIAVIFFFMSMIRIRVLSSILFSSLAIVFIFSFIWPGIGSILRIVFFNLYVGGGAPVIIYIKDDYRGQISPSMFLNDKEKYETVYNNPLKPLSLILWGNQKVYLYNNKIKDCKILSEYLGKSEEDNLADCRVLLTLDINAIAGINTFRKR